MDASLAFTAAGLFIGIHTYTFPPLARGILTFVVVVWLLIMVARLMNLNEQEQRQYRKEQEQRATNDNVAKVGDDEASKASTLPGGIVWSHPPQTREELRKFVDGPLAKALPDIKEYNLQDQERRLTPEKLRSDAPPTRLCCGQKHHGPVCPDSKVMCCLCFGRFSIVDLNTTPEGKPEDVCKGCAKMEATLENDRSDTPETDACTGPCICHAVGLGDNEDACPRDKMVAMERHRNALRTSLINMIDMWQRSCAPRDIEKDEQIIEARSALNNAAHLRMIKPRCGNHVNGLGNCGDGNIQCVNCQKENFVVSSESIQKAGLHPEHYPVADAIPELEVKEKACTSVCATCKHFGAQGRIGLVKEEGGERYCALYLFGEFDKATVRMPDYRVTWGSNNGAKGCLFVHEKFGCVNHDPEFDKS